MSEADILLTGGGGQIGLEFRRLAYPEWRVFAPSRDQLDIADPVAVNSWVASRAWSAVINAAAYTAVDRAETDSANAWRVNALGPAILAETTARTGVPLIQLSTDYVFDGQNPEPYVEDDPVSPLGVYGASKEGGEQAVRAGNPRHIILRTAWVVSPHGSNFVKTMLRLATERPVVRVVDDQVGSPTGAADVALALVGIVERLLGPDGSIGGTYHFVNQGEATWWGLARAVFDDLAARGGAAPVLEAIGTADYPTPARRPANSRLSTAKLTQDLAITPRPWRLAVDEVVEALLNQPARGS